MTSKPECHDFACVRVRLCLCLRICCGVWDILGIPLADLYICAMPYLFGYLASSPIPTIVFSRSIVFATFRLCHCLFPLPVAPTNERAKTKPFLVDFSMDIRARNDYVENRQGESVAQKKKKNPIDDVFAGRCRFSASQPVCECLYTLCAVIVPAESWPSEILLTTERSAWRTSKSDKKKLYTTVHLIGSGT